MAAGKIYGNLFLSIGAMKAGTTWLFTLLARHPELHVTPEKEIHYFYHRYVNPDFLSERRRLHEVKTRYLYRFDPQRSKIDEIRRHLHWMSHYLSDPIDDFWYRNLFHMRGREKWACDFSNLYAHLPPEAWPGIAGRCDRLRVIYTMRHPVARLWSHTKFHLQVAGELDKLDSWGPDDFDAFLRQPHIWENSEYGAVLRRMKAGLAPENTLVLFYENIHADQRAALAQIEAFLELTPFEYHEDWLKSRRAKSVERPMPDFFPGLLERDVARICDEVEAEGFAVPPGWRAAPAG